MKLIITSFIVLWGFHAFSQSVACTAPGQNPSTAFPVCGTSTFTQASVPICGGRSLNAPGCPANVLGDVNPFWYKFTCFKSGTLGFQIAPHTNSEDYDWQVFDITGKNPNDVYTNNNLVVACNWSGEGGTTGASNAGTSLFVCDGYGRPLWSKMPDLIAGHEYLLLVSHFTQTQSGYNLSFGGGSAVITDSTLPKLNFAEANCGGTKVRLKLNKKMKCNSIAADGSDFYIMPGNISLTSAIGFGCSTGFDADSIEISLASPLAPGNYTVNVRQGGDGNTILDYCDKPLPLSEKMSFTVYPLQPTPMDSIAPLSCKTQSLRLVFPKPVLCSTIASNGSDFIISGNYPVAISGASGGCSSGSTTTKEIIINLSQPLYQNGNFTVTLKNGTDGNTILDECSQQTPAGSFLNFNVRDTVNADFSYQKFYGCSFDTVNYFHPAGNGVNSWHWTLGENKTSTLQNPQAVYSLFNQKTTQLIVSNGFCSDTSSQAIILDNFLKADFVVFPDNCPNEPTIFTGSATGKVIRHEWTFGDGGNASVQSPTHIYQGPQRTTVYKVRYTVTDSIGCQNYVEKTIRIHSSCLLAVPNAFTPNNDGLNDKFGPLNAVKAEKLDFSIYNRWGQLIYKTNDWTKGWDGTIKGRPQATDVYVWFLSFTDRDSKQSRQMKGTVTLIR